MMGPVEGAQGGWSRRIVAGATIAAVAGTSVALAATGTRAVASVAWSADGNGYDRFATAALLAGLWVVPACGAVVWWLRRRTRAARVGQAVVLLGAALGTWAWLVYDHGDRPLVGALVVTALRPIAFWVLLAWPVGRSRPTDSRWLVAYTAAFAGCFAVVPAATDPVYGGVANDHLLAELPSVAAAFSAFGSSVVLPLGAVVLPVAVAHRHRQLPRTSRWRVAPIVAAAVVVGAADLLLVASDYVQAARFDDEGRTTLLGALIPAADYARFSALAALVVVAAVRSRRRVPAEGGVRRLELPDHPGAAAGLQASVAAALDDPTARVVYAGAGGTWVAADGAPTDVGGDGRRVVAVARDGAALAAVEVDASVDRPTAVETSVAAAAATIDDERLRALANARRAEALRSRRVILEVQDAARARIERDLHDGAQQRLVALALQATLDAQRPGDRTPEDIARDLRAGLDAARAELRGAVDGSLAEQMVGRGLDAAVVTLAATTPVAIDVDVHQPAHLPPSVATTAWFVVAEAVANATKHASASRLGVRSRVVDGRFTIEVCDDGIGGARVGGGRGLTGLEDRVARSGGELTVDSPTGGGTTVVAAFPMGAT
jgi:signal transduction histidine kinase